MLVSTVHWRSKEPTHLLQVPGAMFVGVADAVVEVVVVAGAVDDDTVDVVVALPVPTQRTCPISRSQFASSQGLSAWSCAAVMSSLVSMAAQRSPETTV